jgi:hypothetical protein
MTTKGTFFDAATGITEDRELTAEELALLEANAEYAKQKTATDKAKADAKKVVLAKLGLTANEVAALLS